MTVNDLFKEAGLPISGPVPWRTKIDETTSGVYVVAMIDDPDKAVNVPANYLEEAERKHWLANEPIVYIGCTTRPLSARLSEFYRHRYGNKAPHRGGQAVKLLKCDMWVFWSPAADPFETELTMLCAFKKSVGTIPFANRLSRSIG